MTDAFTQRRGGILLHPTALPGPHGIGDLGPMAYRFVDLLEATKLTLWQVLPLGPTSFGYSPYQSPSAFAGNQLLISLELLQEEGYWEAPEFLPDFSIDQVDFSQVASWKQSQLRQTFQNFQLQASEEDQNAFAEYCLQEVNWLDDFALFMAIKEHCGGTSWDQWPAHFTQREPQALTQFRTEHAATITEVQWQQFIFDHQWRRLRDYATQRKVEFFGDIPIFVAYDSADVWAHRHWFQLEENGQPSHVAGVPPDYFSETGQRWGNPLYDWQALVAEDYSFWKQRLSALLRWVQWVRIDHFRGFESFWSIPANEPTAVVGEWEAGPGLELFKSLKTELGELPIVAEDLGLITPEVHALRRDCGFPGMKVLQFAFYNDPQHPFLPHSYSPRAVAYTGTHDNNTTRGWWQELSAAQQLQVQDYLQQPVDEATVSLAMIRLVWSSSAVWAIAPLQDWLNLDASCRFNIPGTTEGNWQWRCRWESLESLDLMSLHQWTQIYGRAPG